MGNMGSAKTGSSRVGLGLCTRMSLVQPTVQVTYSDWNSSPQLSADIYAKVPDGYQRLKIMRHRKTVVDEESGSPQHPSIPRLLPNRQRQANSRQ